MWTEYEISKESSSSKWLILLLRGDGQVLGHATGRGALQAHPDWQHGGHALRRGMYDASSVPLKKRGACACVCSVQAMCFRKREACVSVVCKQRTFVNVHDGV